MRELNGHSIETQHGRFFDYENPTAEQVDLHDIVTGLAATPRFGGFTTLRWTVLDHVLLVYDIMKMGMNDRRALLAGLHHDSHEAYVCDVPTPMKAYLGDPYRRLVSHIDYAIAEWLGLGPGKDPFGHPNIKHADLWALRMEAEEFKHSRGEGPHWSWPDMGVRPDVPILTGRRPGDFYRAHFSCLI